MEVDIASFQQYQRNGPSIKETTTFIKPHKSPKQFLL